MAPSAHWRIHRLPDDERRRVPDRRPRSAYAAKLTRTEIRSPHSLQNCVTESKNIVHERPTSELMNVVQYANQLNEQHQIADQ
jgi:hypothetical protein